MRYSLPQKLDIARGSDALRSPV